MNKTLMEYNTSSLSYENDMYSEILSKMPKINSKVNTKEGEGTVVYNNILKETVTVKIENEAFKSFKK